MRCAILFAAISSLLLIPSLEAKSKWRGGHNSSRDYRYYENGDRSGYGWGRDPSWHRDKWRAKAERDEWKRQEKYRRDYEKSLRKNRGYRDRGAYPYGGVYDRGSYGYGGYPYSPGYYNRQGYGGYPYNPGYYNRQPLGGLPYGLGALLNLF